MAPRGEQVEQMLLRLFVAGRSTNSIKARANLDALLRGLPGPRVVLEVVDVLRDPERGLREGVVVTPTLVKVAPAPERRIIGNLQDLRVLRAELGLDEPADG